MITSAAKLSLKACIYLQSYEPERPLIKLTTICDVIESPIPYTSKVLANLVKHGLLYSAKGPKGGFGLKVDSKDIKVIQIVAATEDLETLNKCFLEDRPCHEGSPCSMHTYFSEARQNLLKSLERTCLFDISYDTNAHSFLK